MQKPVFSAALLPFHDILQSFFMFSYYLPIFISQNRQPMINVQENKPQNNSMISPLGSPTWWTGWRWEDCPALSVIHPWPQFSRALRYLFNLNKIQCFTVNHRPFYYYHFYCRERELSLRKGLEANRSNKFNILRLCALGLSESPTRGRMTFRVHGPAHFLLLQETAERLATVGLLPCRAVLVIAGS